MATQQQRSQSRRQQATAASPRYHRVPAPPPPPPAPPLSPIFKRKTPYSILRDYRVLEREKRVTSILSNERFRSELESILQGQREGTAQPKKTNLQKQQNSVLQSPNRGSRVTGGHGGVGEAIIPIDDLRGISASKYTVVEKQIRCKLAAVYRLVDLFGWSHLIYNHITACCPRTDHTILVNTFGLLYSEVTASNLVAVDIDGHIVDPGSTQLGINQAGYVLHSAIHAARRDLKCVVHVHTTAGVAVSAMSCGLLPTSEEALSLGGISYHDSQHLSPDEQRRQIAEDLGPINKVLVLRNHGLVAMGRSIEEAFHITQKLVKACKIQVAMMSVGINNILRCSEGVWSKNRPCLGSVDKESTFTILGSIVRKWKPGELEFEALMRMLDNKGYNTGYRYKGLSLLEPDTGKVGTWNRTQDEEEERGRRHREVPPSEDWDFLDQRKIDRTEPVIKSRGKSAPRAQEDTRTQSDQELKPNDETPAGQDKTLPSMDPTLSPLARAELAAEQVAQSTGEAVQRLAKDSSLQLRQTEHSPVTHVHSSATTPMAASRVHQPTHALSPLEMAQYTAEQVAKSTGQAVRKLTLDITTKTLHNGSIPEHLMNGDLETSSEPSLLSGRTHSRQSHQHIRGDMNGRSNSLKHIHRLDTRASSKKTSTPHLKGRAAIHRSLEDISGFSPLEKVTHTAERVAGSTGVAVIKLTSSLTSP